MKNLTRLSVGLLLAAVVGFSSCVKNEVSDEVTALRQAQVSLLNAEITAILADANFVDAGTAYQLLQNAFKEAEDALTLQEQAAEVASAIVDYEAQMEENRLALEEATNAYNLYITAGAFQETVETYAENWVIELNNLYGISEGDGLYFERLDMEQDLADAQLLLDEDLTWDEVKARLEVKLGEKEAKLTAANAALTAYETTLADPADIEAQKEALKVTIDSLKGANRALDVELTKADNAIDAAFAARKAAKDVIDEYEGFVSDTVAERDNITASELKITNATTALVQLNINLNRLKSTLATANTALSAAETAYNSKLSLYNTAKTNYDVAQANYDAKVILQDVAQSNYDADPSAANLALLNTAIANTATALATLNTATTALGAGTEGSPGTYTTARLALYNAEQDVDAAQSDVDDAFEAIYGTTGTVADPDDDSPQDLVDAQMEIISDEADEIEGFEFDLANRLVKIANLQTAYDAAVAGMPALETGYRAAVDAKKPITAEWNANDVMIDELDAVASSLKDERDWISGRIKDKQDEIKDLEDDVADYEHQIAGVELDKAWAEGEIVVMQAALADINVLITSTEAMAEYWKKLMDDAIAAQG